MVQPFHFDLPFDKLDLFIQQLISLKPTVMILFGLACTHLVRLCDVKGLASLPCHPSIIKKCVFLRSVIIW